MIVQNFSSGILASPITSSSTSITVNAGNTLPSVSGAFTAIIWNSSVYSSPALDFNAEIVWGYYSSPNNYTITRAMEGTAAVAHSAGAAIGLYITAGVLSIPYIKVSNTLTQNTSGGGATSGSWQTRAINTKDSDTASIATLSGNQITLPAGTYDVDIKAVFNQVDNVQMRLYDITHSAVLISGIDGYAVTTALTNSLLPINGRIILTAQSTLAVQYFCNTTSGTYDLGCPTNAGPEVYLTAEFRLVNT